MIRSIVLTLLLAGWTATGRSQPQTQSVHAYPQAEQVSIEDCYLWARENYPLVNQLGLIDKTAAYNLSNAAKGWLPQVVFSAQASYQSDVTSLPFDLAQLGFAGVSVPSLSRDQYGTRVEVSQTVWDGGVSGAAREGISAAAGVETAGTEVNLYALRERVNGLFFGILLTGERLERLTIMENDLDTNLRRVEAYVRSGLAGQADLDAIRIEQLKAAQQRAALTASRRAWVEMLSRVTGRKFGEQTEFLKPPAVPPSAGAVKRPELAVFDAQIQHIRTRESHLDAAITPRLNFFVTGGYGKPGLNMLANRFESYYVVGARINWNIGGLYTRKNDRKQIDSDIRGVELRREAFLLGTELDIMQNNREIERCIEQLRYDDEIIALYSSVLRSSEAKMAGGTLSGSDLVRDINAVEAARQDKILHEMELLIAIYNLKFAQND